MVKLPKNLKIKKGDIVKVHAYQAIYLVKIKEILKDRISGSFITQFVFQDGTKKQFLGQLRDSGDFMFRDISELKKVNNKFLKIKKE